MDTQHNNVIILGDYFNNNCQTNPTLTNPTLTNPTLTNPVNIFFSVLRKISQTNLFNNYDYYYFSNKNYVCVDNIYKIKHINNSYIHSNFSYNGELARLIPSDDFIIKKDVVNFISSKWDIVEQLLNNDLSIEYNLSNILNISPYCIKISLLVILDTDDIDFNFMYQIWIKNLTKEHNIHVIALSTKKIPTDNIVNSEFIHIINSSNTIKADPSQFNKLIYYIKHKKIFADWVIYSNQKTYINLTHINNNVSKWYNYDILYKDKDVFSFKDANIHLINKYFDNIILKDDFTKSINDLSICGDHEIINFVDFYKCADNILDKYLGIII
jgi:hypothetical protein